MNELYFVDVPKRVNIIGVPISVVNIESVLAFLVSNRERLSGTYICVCNVHTTVMAAENKSYFNVFKHSLLCLPDGWPLFRIGKRKFKYMGRVTGPDFMRSVFQSPDFSNSKHFFYGSKIETLNNMIEKLESKYKINVVGSEPSVFRDLHNDEIKNLIDKINCSHADFIWVGLGAPRQEYFCSMLQGKLNGCMVGVGGAFNIFAGEKKEAPRWIQNIGMEWLFRFIQEPRRLFKRYFVTNLKFIYFLILNKDA